MRRDAGADGGSGGERAMSDEACVKDARAHLVQGVLRSTGGFDEEVCEHLAAAERRLHDLGRHDLADRTRMALHAGPVSSEARVEMREVMQLLDAELEPAVSTGSFVAASDGGELR